jgi:hypothetical protein
MNDSFLRARVEQYYATMPLLFADAEDYGPLRLFVRREPGASSSAGPYHARPSSAGADAADIARVRARQRELGVPDAFEWLAEVVPSFRPQIDAAGLAVTERPLMALDPRHPVGRQSLPPGVAIRVLDADDPTLPTVLAVSRLAFADEGAPPGSAGSRDLSTIAAELTADGTVAMTRSGIRLGHKTVAAACGPDGSPLGAGHYHPAEGTSSSTTRARSEGAAVTTTQPCRADKSPATTTAPIKTQNQNSLMSSTQVVGWPSRQRAGHLAGRDTSDRGELGGQLVDRAGTRGEQRNRPSRRPRHPALVQCRNQAGAQQRRLPRSGRTHHDLHAATRSVQPGEASDQLVRQRLTAEEPLRILVLEAGQTSVRPGPAGPASWGSPHPAPRVQPLLPGPAVTHPTTTPATERGQP